MTALLNIQTMSLRYTGSTYTKQTTGLTIDGRGYNIIVLLNS